ncbi:hypothetical protein BGX27_004834 [Mortierella sp. AM989]|nr:hypothetical protein BGX27_004834 [Mortierella sp. AM989]
MRFSIASTVVAVSSLALLSSSRVSAALTPQERVAYELSAGPEPNYCGPCLTKAMHNHFPHACAANLNSDEANNRPTGPTDAESRCVCIAFQDLYWKKKDCSLECPYVHNEKAMQYFLPSEKIEGCDKWIDFSTGKEKVVEGFAIKNEDHVPEVFEIAPPPVVSSEADSEDDGRFKLTVNVKHAEEKKVTLDEKAEKKELADTEANEDAKVESEGKDEL